MHWIILIGIIAGMIPLMAFSASIEKNTNLIETQVQKRRAAGEKANRLIDEQSPYLLQHAFNPVVWYPWGEEALSKARAEDKPIFLSIGYSTCHWCHVMAHKSFENPGIARLLNRWLVSIKVDREERPDIDQMYMAATQAMTGSGGWPMSVFLMPDASPFYAGTYFPPTSVSGRPGFNDVLTSIHKVWVEKRDELQETAYKMVSALKTRSGTTTSAIKEDIYQISIDMLEKSYDPGEGGFQVSHDEIFAETAREFFSYLLRDMQGAGGGFYSAEDADSENPYNPGHHSEGAFYLWTKEDILKFLGTKAAEIFISKYGIVNEGNVKQDPMHEFSGRNILYKAQSNAEIAERFGLTIEETTNSLATSKEILFNTRSQRQRPHLDDKIITAWNGMMIGALARGSRILQAPQLEVAAEHTAYFLKNNLYTLSNNTLHRRYRNKQAGTAGQLADYAYLVNGLLELYQTSHNPTWLKWATELTEKQIELFWSDKDNFFYDSVTDPSIKVRMKSDYDGAEPTGNSVAVHNLLRLGLLQNKPSWSRMAERLVESFSGSINRYPPALPLMLNAWRNINTKPMQVVIAGNKEEDDTKALLRIVDATFDGARLVLLADGAENQAYLSQTLPFMETVTPLDGKATAYVCYDFTCKMPVTEPKALQLELKANTKF